MTEQAKEKRKAELTREKFLLLNQETTFKKSIYDSKSRSWVIPVEKFDENAKKFNQEKKEPKEAIPKKRKLKPLNPDNSGKKKYARKPNANYFAVIKLFKEGFTNKEISTQLGISVNTAQVHVKNYHNENNLIVIPNRGKNHKVIDRRQKIYQDYKKGMGLKEIAIQHGISAQVCSQDLRIKLAEYGEKVRDFKREKRDLCYKLFSELKTNSFISDHYGIPRSTVSGHRRNYNNKK